MIVYKYILFTKRLVHFVRRLQYISEAILATHIEFSTHEAYNTNTMEGTLENVTSAIFFNKTHSGRHIFDDQRANGPFLRSYFFNVRFFPSVAPYVRRGNLNVNIPNRVCNTQEEFQLESKLVPCLSHVAQRHFRRSYETAYHECMCIFPSASRYKHENRNKVSFSYFNAGGL